jgi:hypothetical protein
MYPSKQAKTPANYQTRIKQPDLDANTSETF